MTKPEDSGPRSDETVSPETAAPASPSTPAVPPADPPASASPSATAGDAADQPATEPTAARTASGAKPSGGGPLSLERIRQLRKNQELAARQQRAQEKKARSPAKRSRPRRDDAEPASESPATPDASDTSPAQPAAGAEAEPAVETGVIKTPPRPARAPKVEVPSRRKPLPRELEEEIRSVIEDADLDTLLIGDDLLQISGSLEEGQRVRGQVVKMDDEFAFVALGGPHEGIVSLMQFEKPPEVGAQIDVIVRGYLASDGMYDLSIPGSTVDVTDWSDLQEGTVVEATVTAANTGGLECSLGNIRGFIPLSQISEYRVENPSDYVGQKLMCVVTEANPRRGNLVLSHRAVLERERQAKRAERLASLEVGQAVEGVVRKILDFGAFVDIGGVDGLLHVSQLAWERVQHPSEILEEGQKIKVRIDKIDPQTGKISLSYRSLQEHPWKDIAQRYPAGSIHRGTVTRIAEFGAFVRLTTGVEGLVHISELAHHRVSNVGTIVKEGQEVDVKVLSVDEASQRMSLSMKAVQAAPQSEAGDSESPAEPDADRKPVLPKHRGPLKGGLGRSGGGEQFGLKW